MLGWILQRNAIPAWWLLLHEATRSGRQYWHQDKIGASVLFHCVIPFFSSPELLQQRSREKEEPCQGKNQFVEAVKARYDASLTECNSTINRMINLIYKVLQDLVFGVTIQKEEAHWSRRPWHLCCSSLDQSIPEMSLRTASGHRPDRGSGQFPYSSQRREPGSVELSVRKLPDVITFRDVKQAASKDTKYILKYTMSSSLQLKTSTVGALNHFRTTVKYLRS